MKSILFDVDGVFLSEERCFDVSALTVEEILKHEDFLGLDTSIPFKDMNDELIHDIRKRVFKDDQILTQLKSLGLNSNWDMLFVVFSIHFINILKTLNKDKINKVLNYDSISKFELKEIQSLINHHIPIDYGRPLEFINHSEQGKENIYAKLETYAKLQLDVNDASLFKLKGPLWHFSREVYQEWYLGSSLFKEVEDKLPISNFKNGFIYDEVVLRPVEEIQTLLTDLQEAGYQLAIATGRPRTETMVPFKSLGLKQFFQDNHIVTATDVLNAEKAFPKFVPLSKPNPFCYIATLNGNDQSKYKDYVSTQTDIVNKEEVFIVGDSLADLLCAKKIGATFIGTLTGLKGQAARGELENYEADYIIEHVSHIRDILL